MALFDKVYNPDVLSCIANLSNDEVFTPPDMVNKMLDMLPQELFQDPNVTFLDPACKTGVFLREIAKRLIKGLESRIPDLQERLDHIFHKQLFGIAITELTSLLSRRSVYCSKYPNGQFSVSTFADAQGNIRFKKTVHTWSGKKCAFCGASKEEYDRDEGLESYAYEFIHTKNAESIFNMKFDVIIGNPPYQLSDGGGTGSSAMPIYQHFVMQAKKLQPKFLTMIIPARWFSGGKGLDQFRQEMINDDRICILHDFFNSGECFPGVQVEGGVCYFLWARDKHSKCKIYSHTGNTVEFSERKLKEEDCDILIRYNKAVDILKKVRKHSERSFMEIVSSRRPFGLPSTFKEYKLGRKQGCITIYANKEVGHLEKDIEFANNDAINKYKVYISFAYGMGDTYPVQVINKPFIGEKGSLCTETYLLIGASNDKRTVENIVSYMKTKVFRFLVLLKKNTQNGTRHVYQFVPMQDFSKPWTDEELYKKYDLSQEEIDFIESMIKPME